jgi:hypothetical protein
MVRRIRLLGALSLVLALASSASEAQATRPSPIHARAKHKAAQPKEEGRQITVHKGTPSWLTLGGSAEVGSSNGYVIDTFDQPSPAQGTFMGYRGRERVINQFGVPGAPLFQF